MNDTIVGDVLTRQEMKQRNIRMVEGTRGGVEFRAVHVPLDFYQDRKIITRGEYRAGERIFKDFMLSGQHTALTVNLDAIRSHEKRAYLPSEMQREARDSWRKAMKSINGKIGQLMILNVCCYGYWVNDVKYIPYDNRASILRFREALGDLMEYYKNG